MKTPHVLTDDQKFWESVEQRFVVKVNKSGPSYKEFGRCWEWTASVNGAGYGTFNINLRFGTTTAHRMAYLLWVGQIPDGLVIAHHCDNPICVNPKHLFLATRHENTTDAKNKGKFRGEARSKLKNEDVIEMRRLYDAREVMPRALGERYGLHENTITAIVKRRTWRHIP